MISSRQLAVESALSILSRAPMRNVGRPNEPTLVSGGLLYMSVYALIFPYRFGHTYSERVHFERTRL
jgi:hypothetical protein